MRNRQDVIQEFLTDFPEYRECGNRTIARLVMEEYPGVLGTLEDWRKAVLYYHGVNGHRDRAKATAPRPPRAAGEFKRGCPPSLAQPREPFVLSPGKTLLLPDLHVPYHEVGAVELAVEYGIEHGATQVLLVGDFIDCHRLSQFVPDAEAVSFAEELRIAHDVLDYLQDRFQGAKFYYKIGNHEERLERYMYQKAPDVAVVDVWRMDKLLHLDDRGIEYIANKRMILASGCAILHGHELLRGLTAPVNPARGAYMKASCSTVVAHSHKTSEHSDTDLHGKMITCWSLGCLCHLSSNYAPFAKTNHGFGFMEHDGERFWMQNKRIYRGEVY